MGNRWEIRSTYKDFWQLKSAICQCISRNSTWCCSRPVYLGEHLFKKVVGWDLWGFIRLHTFQSIRYWKPHLHWHQGVSSKWMFLSCQSSLQLMALFFHYQLECYTFLVGLRFGEKMTQGSTFWFTEELCHRILWPSVSEASSSTIMFCLGSGAIRTGESWFHVGKGLIHNLVPMGGLLGWGKCGERSCDRTVVTANHDRNLEIWGIIGDSSWLWEWATQWKPSSFQGPSQFGRNLETQDGHLRLIKLKHRGIYFSTTPTWWRRPTISST